MRIRLSLDRGGLPIEEATNVAVHIWAGQNMQSMHVRTFNALLSRLLEKRALKELHATPCMIIGNATIYTPGMIADLATSSTCKEELEPQAAVGLIN